MAEGLPEGEGEADITAGEHPDMALDTDSPLADVTTEDLTEGGIQKLIAQEVMDEFRVVGGRLQEELETGEHKRFIERDESGEIARLVLFSGAEHKGVNLNLVDHTNGKHTITRATITKDGHVTNFEEGGLGKPLHRRLRGVTLVEKAELLVGVQDVIARSDEYETANQEDTTETT